MATQTETDPQDRPEIRQSKAIRELKASLEASHRSYERTIKWLSIGLGAECALVVILILAIILILSN